MAVEEVLCIHKKFLPNFYGVIQLPLSWKKQLLENAIFIPRDEAETSQEYKQIIPYCGVFFKDRIFAYLRSSKVKEGRLKEMWSIGIGGHINRIDMASERIIMACIIREVEEELGIRISEDMVEFLALLNDDTNSVGRVHVGIVCRVSVKEEFLRGIQLEETLDKYKWVELEDVTFDGYETWSVLMAKYFISFGFERECNLELV